MLHAHRRGLAKGPSQHASGHTPSSAKLRPAPQRTSVKVAYQGNGSAAEGSRSSVQTITKRQQKDGDIVVSIAEAPITVKHPAPEGLENYIPSPSTPRANSSASKEKPEGNPLPKDKSVLQNHVAFWDRDGDGKIFPGDTYAGFRAIGFNVVVSALAVPFIHGSFSLPSWPSPWPPHLGFPIFVSGIHRTKHGSDSETYDTEGRFVPDKFEAIFSKFDRDNKGGLNWDDIELMIQQNRNIGDAVGQTAERLEWWATHLLLKNERGVLTKDRILGVIDGSIWEQLAAEVRAKGKLQIKN